MDTRYDTVADALHWLVSHQADQPSLAELARHVGQSEAHVQKTFQAYAGLSPKQFLKLLKDKPLLSWRRGSRQARTQAAFDGKCLKKKNASEPTI